MPQVTNPSTPHAAKSNYIVDYRCMSLNGTFDTSNGPYGMETYVCVITPPPPTPFHHVWGGVVTVHDYCVCFHHGGLTDEVRV